MADSFSYRGRGPPGDESFTYRGSGFDDASHAWQDLRFTARGSVSLAGKPFDFGGGDPLPPVRPKYHDRSRRRAEPAVFQSLAGSFAPDLYDYLSRRHIAASFLREIDLFLENHTELLTYAPNFVREFNSGTPFRAYLFFLKGYTKPARYEHGALPDKYLEYYLPDVPSRLRTSSDLELIDFFDGYDFRYDILDRIDVEVDRLIHEMRHGVSLNGQQRRLVAYATFGNPVDAYKFYEYNYQTEWLPHRYLPEHVVLGEIPRVEDYMEPSPSVLAPSEGGAYSSRRYPYTRLRMARAKDAGVDVIDVLIDEFTGKLVREKLSRPEIEGLRHEAQRAIDRARTVGDGTDIVDLIMGTANKAINHWRSLRVPLKIKLERQPRSGATGPKVPPALKAAQASKALPAKDLPASTSLPNSKALPASLNWGASYGPLVIDESGITATTSSGQRHLAGAFSENGSIKEQSAKAPLSGTKRVEWFLIKLKSAQKMLMSSLKWERGNRPAPGAKEHRQMADRTVINMLIGYGRAKGNMTSAVATELQTRYSTKSQVQREIDTGAREDVLEICKLYVDTGIR